MLARQLAFRGNVKMGSIYIFDMLVRSPHACEDTYRFLNALRKQQSTISLLKKRQDVSHNVIVSYRLDYLYASNEQAKQFKEFGRMHEKKRNHRRIVSLPQGVIPERFIAFITCCFNDECLIPNPLFF